MRLVVKIDYEKCLKCGVCVGACPNGALEMTDKGPQVYNDKCIDCGDCIRICPVDCIN